MTKKTIAVRLSSHEALVRIAADMAKESGKRVTLDEALAAVLEKPVNVLEIYRNDEAS